MFQDTKGDIWFLPSAHYCILFFNNCLGFLKDIAGIKWPNNGRRFACYNSSRSVVGYLNI